MVWREARDFGAAQESHAEAELPLQDSKHPLHSGLSTQGQAVQDWPSQEHSICAESKGLPQNSLC